jgi:hypothetical protein
MIYSSTLNPAAGKGALNHHRLWSMNLTDIVPYVGWQFAQNDMNLRIAILAQIRIAAA